MWRIDWRRGAVGSVAGSRKLSAVKATDPKFDQDETWRFLVSLGPRVVSEVDH